MGGGVVANSGSNAGYAHLIDPNRKWYNNKRLALPKLVSLPILTHVP
jgi:hypothetical protein